MDTGEGRVGTVPFEGRVPDGLAAIRLETERLVLRVPRIEDFERYADMFARDELRSIGGPLVRGDAWRRFLQMPGAWMLQGFAMFSVIEKTTGQWVGLAGPWQPDGWPGTEVGYSLHPDAWGKGYARPRPARPRWTSPSTCWGGMRSCTPSPGPMPDRSRWHADWARSIVAR